MYLASRQMYLCTRVLNMSIVSLPPVTFPLGPAGLQPLLPSSLPSPMYMLIRYLGCFAQSELESGGRPGSGSGATHEGAPLPTLAPAMAMEMAMAAIVLGVHVALLLLHSLYCCT